jgi:DNA primase
LFLTQPVEIHIASMPPDVDPDEYLIRQGAEEFQRLLSTAPDALTYKWKQLVRQVEASGDSLTARQKAVDEYLQTLAGARGTGPVDSLRWGAALARVSRLTEMPVEELNRRFRSAKTPPRRFGAAGGPGGSGAAAARPGSGGGPSDGDGAAVESPPTHPPRRLDADVRAERWILGILLLEPHRWTRVQRHVHVEDFAAGSVHRRLAEIYWDYQRHEGEPVFNEFLGLLGNTDPALAEAAVEAVDEVEALLSDESRKLARQVGAVPTDRDQLLDEGIASIEQARALREARKPLSELRRTSENPQAPGHGSAENKEANEVVLLKQALEAYRRPNLRRV